jgi:hypothetical protein
MFELLNLFFVFLLILLFIFLVIKDQAICAFLRAIRLTTYPNRFPIDEFSAAYTPHFPHLLLPDLRVLWFRLFGFF